MGKVRTGVSGYAPMRTRDEDDRLHLDTTGSPLIGSPRARIIAENTRRIEEDRIRDIPGGSI